MFRVSTQASRVGIEARRVSQGQRKSGSQVVVSPNSQATGRLLENVFESEQQAATDIQHRQTDNRCACSESGRARLMRKRASVRLLMTQPLPLGFVSEPNTNASHVICGETCHRAPDSATHRRSDSCNCAPNGGETDSADPCSNSRNNWLVLSKQVIHGHHTKLYTARAHPTGSHAAAVETGSTLQALPHLWAAH